MLAHASGPEQAVPPGSILPGSDTLDRARATGRVAVMLDYEVALGACAVSGPGRTAPPGPLACDTVWVLFALIKPA